MMIFPMGGTVTSSVKMMELKHNWQQRKENYAQTKQQESTPESRMIQQMQEDAANTRKANAISAIEAKLMSGNKLSPEELDYLKEHSPDLYEKAVEVAREREAYKKALSRCRTKEDVERVNSQKLQAFGAQAKSISTNANISMAEKKSQLQTIMMKLMGVQQEHMSFLNTLEYQNLPENDEDDDKKAGKAKGNTAQALQQALMRLIEENQAKAAMDVEPTLAATAKAQAAITTAAQADTQRSDVAPERQGPPPQPTQVGMAAAASSVASTVHSASVAEKIVHVSYSPKGAAVSSAPLGTAKFSRKA